MRDEASVDLSYLEEVAEGDSTFMLRLLEAFLRNVDALRRDLLRALTEVNRADVRRLAHGLRGVLQTIGAEAATAAASALEEEALAAELSRAREIPSRARALFCEMERVEEQVRRHLGALSRAEGGSGVSKEVSDDEIGRGNTS